MLVWLDLEMTGLDPTSDAILEIATLVTDDELNIVAEGPDLVVHQPPEVLARMGDIVRTMHERSGLLDAVVTSELTLEQAGQATLDFLKAHVPQAGTAPLCGNSIGTDRRFLAAYLPDLDNHVHYRSVDVSTVKELCRRWYPAAFVAAPEKSGAHRALGDIRESVAELAYYRSAIFAAASAGTSTKSPPGTDR